jgi:hypothetical protein
MNEKWRMENFSKKRSRWSLTFVQSIPNRRHGTKRKVNISIQLYTSISVKEYSSLQKYRKRTLLFSWEKVGFV